VATRFPNLCTPDGTETVFSATFSFITCDAFERKFDFRTLPGAANSFFGRLPCPQPMASLPRSGSPAACCPPLLYEQAHRYRTVPAPTS
jgi:hypothetical protein